MNAILDTLILGPSELQTLKSKYPHCITENLTNSDRLFQEYMVIIEYEDESNYYDFLIEKRLAMSSHNFYSRLKSDKRFEEKMRHRIRRSYES